MSNPDRISELLLDWEELREEGKDATAEELCRDCPELTDEVRRRLAALRAMYRVPNGSGDGGATLADAQPSPRAVPVAVPGYDVLRLLGSGGMGVVYQARQLRLKRTVALKMILSGAHATAEQQARFRTEAEAAARLHHPNIVQIYEVGEHAGVPFLALEYVDGGNLAERVGNNLLPPRDAAELIRTLADAIQHAHERGVVHRDLKPANILLQQLATDERGLTQIKQNENINNNSLIGVHPCSSVANSVPKIADFGLAKRLDATAGHTATGEVLGTPSYMAPEQASGRVRDVGPATDVYALGAILYHLLTGRPPFEASTVLRTMELVCTEPPERPRTLRPDVPADLETICLKCLEKDPEHRYVTARALAEDLGRFLGGEPIQAHEVTFFGRLTRLINRTPDVVRARRIHTRLMLAVSPVPVLGQLLLFLFAAGEPWYAAASIWLMLAIGLVIVASVTLAHRAGLAMASSAVSRQLWTLRLGEILAVALVPWVLVAVWPAGAAWNALALYPFWSLTSGVTIFNFGSMLWGRMYLLGLVWFAGAALMPLRLEWSPLAFGALVSLTFVTIVLHIRRRADDAADALASDAPGG